MPPSPKPPGQRRRRNAGQSQWRQLPAEGRAGDPPALPDRDWLPGTLEWWARAWASPMATAWVEADLDALFRLAELKDTASRRPEIVSLHAQITALEDRLGLTPKARRALQWEISQAEERDMGRAPSAVRHLRAVDGAAG